LPDIISVPNAIIAIAALFVLAASFHRLFFGVEITDEAYCIAESRLVAQGGVPFVNNWTQAPSHVILYFWLVPLYESLSGSTEGLFLFMRIAFWTVKLLVLGAVFFTMRKHINPRVLLLFLLPFVPFSPFNINMFSYNSLQFFLLLLAQALVVRFFIGDGCSSLANKQAIWIGAVLALTCLAQPSSIILVVYFLGLLIAVQTYRRKPVTPILFFVMSGLIVAAVVAAALSMVGGGFFRLTEGIRVAIADNPYFSIEKAPASDAFARVTGIIRQHLLTMLLSASIFVFGVSCRIYSIKTKRSLPREQEVTRAVVWVFLVVVTLYVVLLVLKYAPTEETAYSHVECALFPVPLALMPLLPKCHRRTGSALLLSIWAPCMISLAVVAVSSWTGLHARFYLLYGGAMLSTVFFYLALEGFKKDTDKASLAGSAALSVVVILSACVQPYMYFYRDAPFVKLECVVETGVYRGLHTTKERSESLIALEAELRAITNYGDDVLFMEVVPMAYLMTDAAFCAPSTWDAMLYSYGFKEDKIMQKYFQSVGKVPNKIIYIDTGRDAVLSIETDDYQFNAFVNENYTLTHERTEQPYRIKMYELVDS